MVAELFCGGWQSLWVAVGSLTISGVVDDGARSRAPLYVVGIPVGCKLLIPVDF